MNVCEFQTSLTNVFYVWRSSGVFLSVRTVAGSRGSVWSHLLRKLPLSICCGHLILSKVYTNWCSELKQIPVLLILMFVLCSWSELKFPLSLTFSSPANLWLQWWQIVFPKNFKLGFSGVPLKGDFSMLFFPFLSNILCVQFLPAYKNCLKWNPWICLWSAFFSKTDCHGSYLEPTSFCFRAEWCTFPSIFLTQTTKACKFVEYFQAQAICQWTVDLQDLLSHQQPSRSIPGISRMSPQHVEATGMTLGSLASRKVLFSVLKLPLPYTLVKIFGIPKLI